MTLTHLNARGEAHIVDVGDKAFTRRRAVAHGRIEMTAETLALIVEGGLKKGDALAVARIAGIMAAKRTAELIPLCHPIPLTSVTVEITPSTAAVGLDVLASAETTGQTGVEMEALTAASVALLTIYDMAKARDRGMRMTDIELVEKSGGKSGDYRKGD